MSFVDTRLSQRAEAGFSGGPMWSTLVVAMANGAESRNSEWSTPHWKFTADYSVLNPIQQNEIVAAFLALRGQRDSMRFKDWGDFRMTDQALGTGDGTSAPRQLRKFYAFGSATYTRDITLPIASSLVVKANGTPIAATVGLTGLVTPTSPWPNGQVITASCEFDVRVRFGSDYYAFTMPAQGLSQVSVDLVEAITP